MTEEILDIVNEDDSIIGEASRKEAHQQGLLHREINVFFVTPDKKLIFQRRSATKELYPNCLDVTAGGHVAKGESYEQAALKEIYEETGLKISANELHFLTKTFSEETEERTSIYNKCFRCIYAYIFKGKLTDLKIEDGQADYFKDYLLGDIFLLPQHVRSQFTPRFVDPQIYGPIYDKIASLINRYD